MVHLLTSGSRYRQFSLLLRDDRGFLTIRLAYKKLGIDDPNHEVHIDSEIAIFTFEYGIDIGHFLAPACADLVCSIQTLAREINGVHVVS